MTTKLTYPTQAQNNTIDKIKAIYKGKKAYVLLVDIYNEEEDPVQYQIHYDTAIPYALDHRIIKVAEGQDANDIKGEARIVMGKLLDEVMFDMHANEVTVRYVSILYDGDIG